MTVGFPFKQKPSIEGFFFFWLLIVNLNSHLIVFGVDTSILQPQKSMKTFLLYVLTALAEIVGCYLPYLWLSKNASIWLLRPAGMSLALFAWLLTLHDAAAGRVYAAYGGVYIAVALAWLWGVDGVRPTIWDVSGVAVSLAGMSLIAFQPR